MKANSVPNYREQDFFKNLSKEESEKVFSEIQKKHSHIGCEIIHQTIKTYNEIQKELACSVLSQFFFTTEVPSELIRSCVLVTPYLNDAQRDCLKEVGQKVISKDLDIAFGVLDFLKYDGEEVCKTFIRDFLTKKQCRDIGDFVIAYEANKDDDRSFLTFLNSFKEFKQQVGQEL